MLSRPSRCFTDHRDPDRVEHTVQDLIAQRVNAPAPGHEDPSDHDQPRSDPLALLAGKGDITGMDRRRDQGRGKPLAPALNRLEL